VGDFSPAAWLLARESAMVRCEVDPPGLLAAERVRRSLLRVFPNWSRRWDAGTAHAFAARGMN
jgi:hypothetical protein